MNYDSLQACSRLLLAGAMDPDHYRACVRSLVAESRGPAAAARADRLLSAAVMADARSETLPDLAWLAAGENDATNRRGDAATVCFGEMPDWLADSLRDVADRVSPSDGRRPFIPSHALARGRWRRGRRGGWVFANRLPGRAAFAVAKPPVQWEPYTPKSGDHAGEAMEKNPVTGATRPAGSGGQSEQQDQPANPKGQAKSPPGVLKKPEVPDFEANKPIKVLPADGLTQKARAEREKRHGASLTHAVKGILGGVAENVRNMGAAAWQRMAGSKKVSQEMLHLAKETGYRIGRLRDLPGAALEALADHTRTPASPHVPLEARGLVPDLSKAKNHLPGAAEKPPHAIPVREAARGRLPHKGSTHARDLAQKEGLPEAVSPRAASAVTQVRGVASRMKEPRVQAAAAKALARLPYAEALHVYRQLVPHSTQGAMPVPRSSQEAARAVVLGLSAGPPREDQGAAIAADRPAWNAAHAVVAALGDRHAEAKGVDDALNARAAEQEKRLEKSERLGGLGSILWGVSDEEHDSLLSGKRESSKDMKEIAAGGRAVLERSLTGSGKPSRIERAVGEEDARLDPKQQKTIDGAISWLGKNLRDAHVKVSFYESDTGRSCALTPDEADDNTQIHLSAKADMKTVVHELGHAVEHQVPGAKRAAEKFIKYRCGNEEPRDMGEVGGVPGEMGRSDDFAKHFGAKSAAYVGRVYPHGSTEVLSKGLEQMYLDPVGFAKNDPEYFALMHGILSGNQRGGK